MKVSWQWEWDIHRKPIVVQMIGYSGFDFVLIDMEHTPVTIDRELQALIIAANESGMGHASVSSIMTRY